MIGPAEKLFSLKGKVALVTGACGLLGREHCQALSEAGAKVIITDLDGCLCENLAAELPGESMGLSLDVADWQSVNKAAELVWDKFGCLDVLVNNAAINEMFEDKESCQRPLSFETYPVSAWGKQLQVNITGVFLCCQVFGSRMAAFGSGSIINIASTYGLVAPNQSLYYDPEGNQQFFKSPAYPVTKAAVLSLTRYLASYWGSAGVRVNALSPGGVKNGQEEWFVLNYAQNTPLKRMADPGDYRGALVFLASEASAYMTGANLVVDGGWTIW